MFFGVTNATYAFLDQTERSLLHPVQLKNYILDVSTKARLRGIMVWAALSSLDVGSIVKVDGILNSVSHLQ